MPPSTCRAPTVCQVWSLALKDSSEDHATHHPSRQSPAIGELVRLLSEETDNYNTKIAWGRSEFHPCLPVFKTSRDSLRPPLCPADSTCEPSSCWERTARRLSRAQHGAVAGSAPQLPAACGVPAAGPSRPARACVHQAAAPAGGRIIHEMKTDCDRCRVKDGQGGGAQTPQVFGSWYTVDFILTA